MMECASKAAKHSKCLSIGITIDFLSGEKPNKFMTSEICTSSFEERKKFLINDDMIYLLVPGGVGTLDEFFEILTLKQTGVHKNTHIVLVDTLFWEDLINFDRLVRLGTINAEDVDHVECIEYEEIGETIENILKSYDE